MSNESTRTYLHTGSNIDHRLHHLEAAVDHIESRIGNIVGASRIYETAPWGIANQPDFLNQALMVETSLSPSELLTVVLDIEKRMGRQRYEKWGQRLIDIDILFYEDLILNTKDLTIPHPFIQERNFVLVPLEEIAPDFIHPLHQKSVAELRAGSPDPLPTEVFLSEVGIK